jgi:isoquinoline 1-oxidoreductase beta subunit
MDEAPAIDVELITSGAERTGIGEAAVPTVAPAVANALAALTGRRQRRLPLKARPTEAS